MTPPETRANTGEFVVTVKGLVKRYKKGAEALKGLTLNIKKGDLYGLVGPDGAGKTTALKILAGIMEATGGDTKVFGKAPRDARRLIGYVPQNCALYPELSVEENLTYQAGLHGVPFEEVEELKETYLGKMGLLQFEDRLASKLSGGMKQKLALCCALVGKPQLILLDEPTTGLDPIARRELWEALETLSHDGVTAIIATPFLDEAERCNKIALMYEGQIQLEGVPSELQKALNMRRLVYTIKNPEKLNRAPAIIEDTKLSNVFDIYPFGDRLEVLTTNQSSGDEEIRSSFEHAGLHLSEARVEMPTLENVFAIKLKELEPPKKSAEFPHWRRVAIEPSMVGTADSVAGSSAAGGAGSSAGSATDSATGKGTGTTSGVGFALHAQHLEKTFDDFKAVDDVSVDIRYGEIFGLLGANGAGKTTTIKMLSGLAKPTAGEIELLGERSNLRSVEVRKNIGYMSQKFSLYDDLTVLENLKFYAGIYEIPLKLRKQQIDWVIEACNLKSVEKSVVKSLPLGWKQRIAFGAAVMHDPKIIFLDEPTAGVDPLARRQLWTLIRNFAANGAAILVTTHYMDEAEFCNRLAFMADSKIIAQGSPSEIKEEARAQSSGRAYARGAASDSAPERAGTHAHGYTLEDAFIDVVQSAKNSKRARGSDEQFGDTQVPDAQTPDAEGGVQ